MDLRRLEVFCKVYELSSITRAAEILKITQPGVTMHVRRLERELGVALLRRHGREIAPTQAATLFYGYARQIVDARNEGAARMRDYREGRQGHVIVGASTGLLYFLPPLFEAFRECHPDVLVSLRPGITDQIREKAAAGSADLGLVWGPVADERLETETLFESEFALICHPGNPLAARREAVRAEQLASERLILPMPGDSTRKFIEGVLRDLGTVPAPLMELDTSEAMKRAVQGNLGIAVVALKAVEPELIEGSLRRLVLDGACFRRPVVMIRQRASPATPAAGLLIDAVRRFDFA